MMFFELNIISDIFILKVIKKPPNETGYVTLLITVIETCGSSFPL